MAAKYTVGQKVKIVPVKDHRMYAKHLALERYMFKSGTIVDFHFVLLKELPSGEVLDLPRENYIYTVSIEDEVESIPEESLEPCVD